MRRPVSLLLLFAFVLTQLYVAKVPEAHQVQTTGWLAVTRQPGGLVCRNGNYYLVTPDAAIQLRSTGIGISSHERPLNWVDVPEPSGAGVWQVALTTGNIPLLGIGGPVYPSPNADSALWIDPGNRQLYFSQPALSDRHSLSTNLTQVKKIVWAQDAESAAILGQGEQGWGIYVWTRANHIDPAFIPSRGQQIDNFGIIRNQTVTTALKNGQLMVQGRGRIRLPRLDQLRVSSHYFAALGRNSNQAFFWSGGKVHHYPVSSHLKWVGVPRFSKGGTISATLAQNLQGTWSLLMYGNRQFLEVRMPFSQVSEYHLLGFMGDHWILVTIPEGSHRGTYAWWVNL
jgi:hypothetical protein